MKLKTFSVSEVNHYIKNYINGNPILNNIKIEGEISNYKLYGSGHHYFSLKDENSKISCIIFKGYLKEDPVDLYDGLKIEATGSINVYERDGRYQLYIKHIEKSGIGKLYIKFEKLKKTLEAEGLFKETHKKKIPKFQNKIALITSPMGAALRDILSVSSRRNQLTNLVIFPVSVQGESSKFEIVKAIKKANEISGIDLIILSRGGGSIEELWSFNEEIVAREIFSSKIPIISAVGHETDFTISDFVSDLRAPTPSAGAEIALVDLLNVHEKIESTYNNIITITDYNIERLNEKIAAISKDKLMLNAYNNIKNKEDNLFLEYEKTFNLLNSKMNLLTNNMDKSFLKLQGLNPLNQLKKGYSITKNNKAQVVKSIDMIKSGDEITTTLIDGEILSKVIKISKKRS